MLTTGHAIFVVPYSPIENDDGRVERSPGYLMLAIASSLEYLLKRRITEIRIS